MEHAKEESFEDTHCPAKPSTRAFLQFKTEQDRNGFFRLTSRQQYRNNNRTVRFKTRFEPREGRLSKTAWTCEMQAQHNLQKYREIGFASTENYNIFQYKGEIVIATNPNGTFKFHRHEAIRKLIVEKINQWTTKKTNMTDCEQSPQGQCETRRCCDYGKSYARHSWRMTRYVLEHTR